MSLSSLHPAFASPIIAPGKSSTTGMPGSSSRTSFSLARSSSRASKSSIPVENGSPTTTMEHSTLPVIDKNSEIEMGSLGERAMEEGGKEGSVRASAGPGGLELDSKGRRPIILGGREEKIVLASLFFTMFLAGWNDSSIGPLLLPMREYYNISLTIVSLTFVFNFIGFLIAAVANVWLTDKFGFGKTITLGATCQMVAYALQCWAPPFPLFCFSFVISGIGMGLQDAQANAFVARLPNMLIKMSILHAVYGFGAMVCPLISTQFSKMPNWYYHYLCSLAVAIINFASLLFVFRLRTENSILGTHPEEQLANAEGNGPDDSGATMLKIMKTKSVHLFAFFTLFYVGLEVTIGGWMVAYLIEVRGGTANSGYISTGFFGGLTLGRLVFIDLNRRLGERRAIYFYTAVALGLEFIVWFVPSLVGSAVAVSFVGLLLGPFYPIIMSVVSKILPRSLQGGAIGWIACFGQGGSAFFPFVTGVLASKHGVEVMPPVVVGMLVGLYILWFFTPKAPRHDQ
ncbi:major facilitator superfamily domain-containing protein [Mrakia frigida]|uniref:MFS transporter n=1 Tax=Mrakia frigida TaxID=29902 RepID=UPI003FCC267D